MGTVRSWMPRFFASASASSLLSREVIDDGMKTPVTWSGPSASTAIDAVSAESMPPLTPITTCVNSFFVT